MRICHEMSGSIIKFAKNIYMATSINLLRKYVWIVDTIRNSRHITLAEINEKWREEKNLNINNEDAIPARSFFRHLHAIADIFGVDISCNKHDGNTYYIENEEVLNEPSFTSWVFNWLSLDNQISGNPEISEMIMHEATPGGYAYLAIIIEALSKKQKLSIIYNRFYSLGEREHIVEPYGLKQSERRWYLIARADENDFLTVFALDRIIKIRESKESFKFDDHLNVETYFDEVIGVNVDDEYDVEEVKIRVFGNTRFFIENLPIHKSQKIMDRNKEYTEFKFRLRPEPHFQQTIFKYGQDIEVLTPEWLRNEMVWRAEGMLKRYRHN